MEQMTETAPLWTTSLQLWKMYCEQISPITLESFRSYLSRSKNKVSRLKVPTSHRRRGKFFRETGIARSALGKDTYVYNATDLGLIRSLELEGAVAEARRIDAEADASGEWITLREFAERAAVVDPIFSKVDNLHSALWQKKRPVALLFPEGKHRGRKIYHFKLQRYNLSDALAFIEQLRDRPRREVRFRTLVEIPYGSCWVSLKRYSSHRPHRARLRLTGAARRGHIRAYLHNGTIHVDAAEATEYLNWRAAAWLTKHGWSHAAIKSRLAWQAGEDIVSPWATDAPNSLKIYAPEHANE